jgi:hypothetical protein
MTHEEAAELLPWLVNDTLDGEEKEQVLAHAVDCVVCRRDLDELERFSQSVAGAVESMPVPAPDMRNINARIDGLIERRNRRWIWVPRLRGVISSPWRAAFAVQTLLVIVLASALLWRGSDEPEFKTLTQPRNEASGHYLRVVFSPDLAAPEISSLLDELALTVADGPSERGVFTLGLSPALAAEERAQVLADLQKQPGVLFAQPVVSGKNP